jgi:hypothetical protein
VLLRETRFEEAFTYLEKANTDPRLIIGLFPNLDDVDTSSIYIYSGVRDTLTTIVSIDSAGTFSPPLKTRSNLYTSHEQACEKL